MVTMSAFTPYKHIKHVPPVTRSPTCATTQLQSFLQILTHTNREKPQEEMLGAGFLVKNLLKESPPTEEQIQRKETEFASRLELFMSNLGKSSQGHQCIYCGKVYSRKYGLKIHIRTHTGYKPLQCRICSRAFGDPSNLNKHVRLHSKEETPYKCDFCGRGLVRRRDLERHIMTLHSDDKKNIEKSIDKKIHQSI